MTFGVLRANFQSEKLKKEERFKKNYKFFAIIYEYKKEGPGFDFMERPLKKYIRKFKVDPATGLNNVKNPDNWSYWLVTNFQNKNIMAFKANKEQWSLFERRKVIEIISKNYNRYEVWVKK